MGTGRPTAARGRRSARSVLAALVVGSIVTGCLSLDEPAPSPTSSPATQSPPATSAPSQQARDPATLVVAVPTFPDTLLPPASDAGSQLLVDLLYDHLYRLDERQVPHPELAAALPKVSKDGLTWTVGLAPGDLRFQDGSPLTATDVVTSLKLARSPTCSLGRELCATALDVLDDATAVDEATVRITLSEPYAPFLAEVLAQLPILADASLQAGVGMLVSGASGIAADAPDALVTRIYRAVGADACLVATPPKGCDLADHIPELEQMLRDAHLALPDTAQFTDEMGTLDDAAYANELLDRVASLGQVLSRTGTDRLAAALPLLDLTDRPLGSGAYRIDHIAPGRSIDLVAVPGHVGGTPGIPRIELAVVSDPAVATTRLLSGDIDWVIQTDATQGSAIDGVAGAHAALRPLDAQWTLVFNTRKDRLYGDVVLRRAFAMCIDRDGLTGSLGGPDALAATTYVAPLSWAMTAPGSKSRDVPAADALLEGAGWAKGSDGIRVKDGRRLSSSIALRSSQTGLLAFLQGMVGQLQACGIELTIGDLDLTGDSLLQQLRWPNDFDTLLTMRAMGSDPDSDVQAFESSHATSATQEVDANPGGFKSSEADQLIAQGRQATDQTTRTELYGRLQSMLDRDVPVWPVWWDTGWAAIADRVRGPDGAIDPSVPDYAWDVPAWTLGPLEGSPPPSP